MGLATLATRSPSPRMGGGVSLHAPQVPHRLISHRAQGCVESGRGEHGVGQSSQIWSRTSTTPFGNGLAGCSIANGAEVGNEGGSV